MKTTGVFGSMLSGIGIFMVAVGLSLVMVQPAFAIEDCDGSCRWGIVPVPPPTENDCLTVDCGVNEDCYCAFGYNGDVDDFYCTCVPDGP
jgi:hypothetical protein